MRLQTRITLWKLRLRQGRANRIFNRLLRESGKPLEECSGEEWYADAGNEDIGRNQKRTRRATCCVQVVVESSWRRGRNPDRIDWRANRPCRNLKEVRYSTTTSSVSAFRTATGLPLLPC